MSSYQLPNVTWTCESRPVHPDLCLDWRTLIRPTPYPIQITDEDEPWRIYYCRLVDIRRDPLTGAVEHCYEGTELHHELRRRVLEGID